MERLHQGTKQRAGRALDGESRQCVLRADVAKWARCAQRPDLCLLILKSCGAKELIAAQATCRDRQ